MYTYVCYGMYYLFINKMVQCFSFQVDIDIIISGHAAYVAVFCIQNFVGTF